MWWDGELFRGKPDWNKLHAYPVPKLRRKSSPSSTTGRGKPVALVDDWQVSHVDQDMSPEAWKYINQGLPRHDHPEEVRRT